MKGVPTLIFALILCIRNGAALFERFILVREHFQGEVRRRATLNSHD